MTAVGAAAGAATDALGAATPAEDGEGRRTVGAAVGLGGKLMRTVSFFGCTLAASLGFGGTEPAGGLGVLSDINFSRIQIRVESKWCQTLIPRRKKTGRRGAPTPAFCAKKRVSQYRSRWPPSRSPRNPPPPPVRGGAFFFRARDVHGQGPVLEFFAVEHLHRLVCFLPGGVFDEGKAARFASELVQHQIHGSDDTCLGKILLQVIFHRLVSEITNEESRFVHCVRV